MTVSIRTLSVCVTVPIDTARVELSMLYYVSNYYNQQPKSIYSHSLYINTYIYIHIFMHLFCMCDGFYCFCACFFLEVCVLCCVSDHYNQQPNGIYSHSLNTYINIYIYIYIYIARYLYVLYLYDWRYLFTLCVSLKVCVL